MPDSEPVALGPGRHEPARALAETANLRNIAIKIAYCGQNFAGWQCQPQCRTVEGDLREALNKLHKGSLEAPDQNGVVLYAAGRTDAGVHASAQVANFYTDISARSLAAERFREALNSHLAKDIRILQSWEVPTNFHARYSALARVYHYRIIQDLSCVPEQRSQAWYVRAPQLDVAVLNSMVAPLLGEHDFSAFTVAGDQAKTKVRRVYSLSFYYQGPYIVFRIVGNAFLWHMVRSIVGTAVGLYCQRHKVLARNFAAAKIYDIMYAQRFELREQMARRLAKQDLSGGHTGFNAPPHGLCLNQVIYAQKNQKGLDWQWSWLY